MNLLVAGLQRSSVCSIHEAFSIRDSDFFSLANCKIINIKHSPGQIMLQCNSKASAIFF
jgi:hypothetical protein